MFSVQSNEAFHRFHALTFSTLKLVSRVTHLSWMVKCITMSRLKSPRGALKTKRLFLLTWRRWEHFHSNLNWSLFSGQSYIVKYNTLRLYWLYLQLFIFGKLILRQMVFKLAHFILNKMLGRSMHCCYLMRSVF